MDSYDKLPEAQIELVGEISRQFIKSIKKKKIKIYLFQFVD